jgi:hypothetical protein
LLFQPSALPAGLQFHCIEFRGIRIFFALTYWGLRENWYCFAWAWWILQVFSFPEDNFWCVVRTQACR